MDYNYEKLVADLKRTLREVKTLYAITEKVTKDIAALLSPLTIPAEHDAATITYKRLTRLVDSFTFRIDHNKDLSTQEQIIAEFIKFVVENDKSYNYVSSAAPSTPLADRIELRMEEGEEIDDCKVYSISSMVDDHIKDYCQNNKSKTAKFNETFKKLVSEFGEDKIFRRKDKFGQRISIKCLPITFNMKISGEVLCFYTATDIFPMSCHTLSPDKICDLIKELQSFYPSYEKKWSEAYELAAKNQKLKKTNQIAFMEFINKKLKVKKKD